MTSIVANHALWFSGGSRGIKNIEWVVRFYGDTLYRFRFCDQFIKISQTVSFMINSVAQQFAVERNNMLGFVLGK